MNQLKVNIENLKCHGCAATIKKGLNKFEKVNNVKVDVDNSIVEINYEDDNNIIDAIKAKLLSMGYPESGNNNRLSVAKSYVSCAIGRISQ